VRLHRATPLLAVLLLAAFTNAVTGPAQVGSARSVDIGVYVGAGNKDGVAAYSQWLGRDVTRVLDYIPGRSWDDITNFTWLPDQWAHTKYNVVYSVPMLPDNGASLATGATGAYDDYFRRMAQMFVAHGQGNAVLRIGWEFNGSWFRWSADGQPATFAAYWRHIVDAIRSVPGANFTFDWCPNLNTSGWNVEAAYPGDNYVDYVGLDLYDSGWEADFHNPDVRWNDMLHGTNGLEWQAAFGAAHHKPLTYPEWGVIDRPDGHGGGDSPSFIQHMHDWIIGHDVAYALYFEMNTDGGDHVALMDGQFPNSAATMRQAFGPNGIPEGTVAVGTNTTASAGVAPPPPGSPLPPEAPTPEPVPTPIPSLAPAAPSTNG